jgi:hypothetical protein
VAWTLAEIMFDKGMGLDQLKPIAGNQYIGTGKKWME